MSQSITLRGITWNHTRGHLPMVATAQRFHELHPEVSLIWEVRSLQAFGDAPLKELARRYDLLVVDHPFIGQAAEEGLLLPLDVFLPAAFLADQAQNSVGASHASYQYEGRQWALAIDAAAPVSGWRPDLLEKSGARPPASWEDLLEMARAGLVLFPAVPIDSLMHFYMLCIALGAELFKQEGRLVEENIGCEALHRLRELLQLCGPECLHRNPITVWETLAASHSVAFCPFAYGYSNYARPGYAAQVLEFGGLVQMNGVPLRSVLGGAGLAVSAQSTNRTAALQYAQFVASERCQQTLYFDSGGQPGHRGAWLDAETNRRSHGFFSRTLPVLDAACLRPRHAWYPCFQEEAATVVHRFLGSGGSEMQTVQELNHLYRKSRGSRRA
ncbi:MAG: extracellular solute-binding protein [Bacillota bacterium]|nr:extracellular solute-binding protein [Bacillota bacterium]